MTEAVPLQALRQRIDDLDRQLIELFNERARCAIEVAEIKIKHAKPGEHPVFYRPERVAQVLRQVQEHNQGPLRDEDVVVLFNHIMSACLALEQPPKVAYLGPQGTYSQAAALQHFGRAITTVPVAAIDEVFREVASGAVQFGVVPVENSTEGAVNLTLDSLLEYNLRICGEVEMPIHHNLLVARATKPEHISRIYSHAQSLAQCRKWLDSHYPKAERVALDSNAEAARRVQDEWNSAAIAGNLAAELYDLQKLQQSIEDRPDNTTRFLVIGDLQVAPSGDDATSIIVSVRNHPGALQQLLLPFQQAGLDLTHVESRPSRSGKWNYVFFIDFRGHQDESQVKAVLQTIADQSVDLKVLGSYPRAPYFKN